MKPTVRYGLFDGATAIVWTMLMYVTELNRSDSSWIFNLVSLAILITFMALCINQIKSEQGGYISFGNAFKSAFIVGLIGGLIGSVFMLVYVKYIDTGFIPFMMHKQELKFEEKGMDQEAIDNAMAMTGKMMSPLWFFIWGIAGSLFVSAILALIMAGIMKKQDPTVIA